MRFFLIIFAFVYSIQCFSHQIIVRIVIEETKSYGYGVEMFYLFEDKNDFKESISKINSVSEREVLNAFKIPLVEPKESLGRCRNIDTLRKSNIDFFRKKRTIKIEKGNTIILISVSPISVDYCEFALTNKYWGSYDVNFKKAAVIIANRNKGCGKRIPKSYMKEIQELFKNIP